MRLYRKPTGTYYVEFKRGIARSLHTKNFLKAQRAFKVLKETDAKNKLAKLGLKKALPLSTYQEEYIASRRAKAGNTLRLDRESFEKLRGFLGDKIAIQLISRKQCDDFISYLLKKEYEPSTVNIAIRHLKTAFNKAVEWEYLDRTPWQYIKQVPLEDTLPRALNRKELDSFLGVIDDPVFKEYALTCLYIGGRRTETARIQWQDFQFLGGQWQLKLTKTKSHSGIIPVADKLRDLLFYRKKDLGPVFEYYYEYFKEASKHFRKYADKVGLNGAKLHDLRHTSATFMILNGVPLKIVSQILRHSSTKVTEIYTKLIAEQLRDGINSLSF